MAAVLSMGGGGGKGVFTTWRRSETDLSCLAFVRHMRDPEQQVTRALGRGSAGIGYDLSTFVQ